LLIAITVTMNDTIARYQKMVEQFPQNELARFSLGKAHFDRVWAEGRDAPLQELIEEELLT